jgi:hypothetical protein
MKTLDKLASTIVAALDAATAHLQDVADRRRIVELKAERDRLRDMGAIIIRRYQRDMMKLGTEPLIDVRYIATLRAFGMETEADYAAAEFEKRLAAYGKETT